MVKLTAKKREVGIVWRIVVCDGDEAEREQILEYARRYGKERQQPVRADGCADWQGLIGQLKEGEPDVVIVAQSGVAGMDIITSAHPPQNRLSWIAIQARLAWWSIPMEGAGCG
ncbi:MAG: hypothetical protein ACLTC4_12050 [Hungatella hathewayi]